jgi:hypothetical protein
LGEIGGWLEAALGAVEETESDPRIGWAWMTPEYRARPERAFHGIDRALTIEDRGLPSLEKAVDALVRDQRIVRNWREDDIWTTVLTILASAHVYGSVDIDAAVSKIINPTPARHVAALANVTWESSPAVAGDLAIARIEHEADAQSLAEMLKLGSRDTTALLAHARQLLVDFGSYVVVTATTARQGELGHEDFLRKVDDVLGLTLLLSREVGYDTHTNRGPTNRPGIRGIALDRGALGVRLDGGGSAELGARLLVLTGWGGASYVRWYSADPVPLDRLMSGDLGRVIASVLHADDAIAKRLRVAARWYARAFWAEKDDDAALAVSVALDSMLTGKEALPGAVSKGRFALLDRDPAARVARFKRYDDVYQVRSAIAHGGDASRRLVSIGGVRSILQDAAWVAHRLLELRDLSAPTNDSDLRDLWSAIQWGTIDWVKTGSR